MKSHSIQIRVRYSETDQMGYVYYGNYTQFLEIGRVEWLRNIGISYREMEKTGIMLPVVSLSVNYKKPAYYDEVITIQTSLKNKPSRKIEFDYQVYNDRSELLTDAYTKLIFVNIETKTPTSCPKYILDRVSDIDFSDNSA